MDGPFNPLAFPLILRAADWLPPSAPADGRLPFARLVVALLAPGQVVALGVGSGATYAALCQAVQALGLPGECLGVELGGPAAGADEFHRQHAARYGGFSRLVAAAAPGPAAAFADGSVDLLHLAGGPGGLSAAQAAEAWPAWQPKLSARAAVLVSPIHDDAEGAQGLAAFWAELAQAHPHLTLAADQGLALVGAQPPAALAGLAGLPPAQQAALRELLHRLGQAAAANSVPANSAAADSAAVNSAAANSAAANLAALQQTLGEQTEHLDQLHGRLEIVTAREREIRGLYLDLHHQLAQRADLAGQAIEKDQTIAVRDGAIAVRDALILEHQRDLAARDALILERERALAARDEALTALRVELALAQADIRTIHAGRIWGLSMRYWQFRYHLAALFRQPAARAH